MNFWSTRNCLVPLSSSSPSGVNGSAGHCSATVVTEKFLKAEPDIVTAWQAAQREATTKAKADWPGFLAYTVSINGFPPKIVAATTIAEQWPGEPFTPEGLELLKGTKQFLVDQKFIRTDFNLDEWIVPLA